MLSKLLSIIIFYKHLYFNFKKDLFYYVLSIISIMILFVLFFLKFEKNKTNKIIILSSSKSSRDTFFTSVLSSEYEYENIYLNFNKKSIFYCSLLIFNFAKKIKSTNCQLIHAFYGDIFPVWLLFLYKNNRQIVIIDYYDTYNGQINKSFLLKFYEKFIFSKANGITCRDLRFQTFKSYSKAPRILISDLIIDTVYKKQKKYDKELHIVNTGWVEFNRGDDSIIKILKQFVFHNIHFHFYPSSSQSINDFSFFYVFYPELLEKSNFIHFHETYVGDDFHEILSQYDFGISVKDNCLFGIQPTIYTNDFVRYGGSSRIRDYILSGLGIIVSEENELQYFQAKRYGLNCIKMDFKLFNNPNQVLFNSLISNNDKDISRLSFSKTSQRVLDFYHKVLIS